ncbi:MAG: L-aspartate oxidase [Coriobacteriia bacterium]
MTGARTETSATLGWARLLDADLASLPRHRCEVLVVGSGIAGLTAALHAAGDRSVALVTKGKLAETNTWYAQGGIAGAVGEADSVELHLADTLVVGQGLCDESVVRAVVSEAGEALRELEAYGMRFDRLDDGRVALAREGGHSLPRVLHSGDATGAQVQDILSSVVRSTPGIDLMEERFLVDLLLSGGRCRGALVLDERTGALEVFEADAVVLATGGCGQAYRVTTNPSVATGDGVAAAWRVGAEVSDLEFVQFHPTALDSDASPRCLITEALRGEGAYLLDCEERRFMPDVHPLAELAPRDVVCRAMERVMARCGRPNVWLDARHLKADHLRSHFPTVWGACAKAGYDLSRDLVPVAPAAHYLIGGVRVDLDGRTSLPGLYASGEVAASGLHGANRLASNSLLEGLVLSRRIVRALETDASPVGGGRLALPEGPAPAGGAMSPGEARADVQSTMASLVAMTRTAEGLTEASSRLAATGSALVAPEADAASLEAADLVTVATLVADAALFRAESRGTHWRADFPERDDARWRSHVVWRRGGEPVLVPAEVG